MYDKKLITVRDQFMKNGYVFDERRSHNNIRHTEGVDYWVDCLEGGRDIRFQWKTAIYPGDPYRDEVETIEVLNRDGTCPWAQDSDEIFELNQMQDFETLDLMGAKTTTVELAIVMSRRSKAASNL